MQLEKVTSRSGSAALAGWISSNDVTLFTTVLVMAIAIFLHAKSMKGENDNARIIHEKAALAQHLESLKAELTASGGRLEAIRNTLTLTNQERDQLQQQLADKLAAMAQLNEKLDVLLHDKGELESQQRVLVLAKDSLSKEKNELVARQIALADDRDSIMAANDTLGEQLKLISSQLAAKISALANVEQEQKRWKNRADELDAIVSTLKQRMEKLNIDLIETKAADAAALTQWQGKIQELKSQLTVRDKTLAERDSAVEEYAAKLKRAAESLQGLTAEKKQLQHELGASQRALSDAELQHQAQLVEEGRNNQELVGLTGRLERVAILFDASGSMRNMAAKGGGDRWAEAQQIAETWLQHLNVQQCVLIVFSSDVRTFPEDGSLVDLRGPAGKAKRNSLLQFLKTVRPGGETNTFEALRAAYGYDIDSILLFSDGTPTVATSGAFDPAAAQQIYELCRAHSSVPIHTVGLGNYFDQNASTFLITLAKITNGTFRGR